VTRACWSRKRRKPKCGSNGHNTTDQELWSILEVNVFTLPAKLGLVEKNVKNTRGKRGKKNKEVPAQATVTTDDRYSMHVYGPLYPQYLLTALNLFDTAFSRPSSYTFKILPRLKSLGLASYVLGVSNALYTRLARIYWQRRGDATSALDMIKEMNFIGLQPDREMEDLLMRIRYDLHGCALGSQGPFVAAMTQSPPYDDALMQRLKDMEELMTDSIEQGQAE
jgi:hypothetical protein